MPTVIYGISITTQEVDIKKSDDLIKSRMLFIRYFSDLYKNTSASTLGIATEKNDYLSSIFDKNEQLLKSNQAVHAFFAYINNETVGFTMFSQLEDNQLVLVHTLPINNEYKQHELDIRRNLIGCVRDKFPHAEKVIVMVRKANAHHNFLCLAAGMRGNCLIFNESEYINNTYDSQWYNAYECSLV